MNKIIFFIFFIAWGFVYAIIGYCASKAVKSLEDFFLAGRNLGLFALTIALIATQLGGGIILGISEQSYNIGYFGLSYIIGISIGFIILSLGLAKRLRRLNIVTTAQIFEVRYKSTSLRKIASLLSIISLCGIFAAQVLSTYTLMSALNVYNFYIFILFWLLVISYAVMGGLRAIVNNDIFQLFFIIIVFVTLFIYDFFSNTGQSISILSDTSVYMSNFKNINIYKYLSIPIIAACYSLIEQDLAQIIFSARNSKVAIRSAFIAALCIILFSFIPMFFGMKAHALGLNINQATSPIIAYFDKYYSTFVVVLAIYGVIAAIISTANSLLCAISSNIVQDFDLIKYDSSYQLIISKTVMALIGLIGLSVGLYSTDIINVLVASYDIPVTSLFISLIVAYYNINLSLTAAYLSMFTGLISFGIFLISNTHIVFSPEIDALILSASAYIIGYCYDYVNNNQLLNND